MRDENTNLITFTRNDSRGTYEHARTSLYFMKTVTVEVNIGFETVDLTTKEVTGHRYIDSTDLEGLFIWSNVLCIQKEDTDGNFI